MRGSNEGVVMPHHSHGVIVIVDDGLGAVREPPLRGD